MPLILIISFADKNRSCDPTALSLGLSIV